MSRTKIKVSDLEYNYKFQGDGIKMQIEKKNEKKPLEESDRLVLHKAFSSMFKNSVKEILSYINNYTSTLECQLCHKKIKNTMIPNYFQLHTEDRKKFITFHFLCVLKPKSIEEFQESMGWFDYTAHKDG